MRLYTYPLSANAHKVKLLLGFLNLPHEEVMIDITADEHRGPAYLAINPLGQIPVFEDDALRLRDSQAILVYLAAKHGAGDWWPADAAGQGRIVQWLAFAALELQNGINRARLHFRLGAAVDLPAVQAKGARTLEILDAHLGDRDWLELGRPTIADLACVTFPARAGEAGHDLAAYPRVAAWVERIRAKPGFLGMEGYDAPRQS